MTVALFLGTVLPGILSVLVVAAGVWVATADVGRENARVLLGWVVVGIAATAGIGVVTHQYQLAHGVVLSHPEHVVLNNVTGGVIGGLFVGYFHIQTRLRTALLADQRDTLAAQREQLEVLNRIVRHDVRNDLMVAQGVLALEREEATEAARSERLARAEHALTNSSHLLDTVGDFIEHEREEPTELTAVNATAVLRRQVDSVRDAYPDATIRLDESPDVAVLADDMLSSVVRNLLTNAVKHNDRDEPTVTVTLTEREETVRITVADDGPGIPDDVKDTVFERGETRLESGNTGLGLSLVTTLVDHYGGDVWVEDRAGGSPAGDRAAPGDTDPRGAVFIVELQRA